MITADDFIKAANEAGLDSPEKLAPFFAATIAQATIATAQVQIKSLTADRDAAQADFNAQIAAQSQAINDANTTLQTAVKGVVSPSPVQPSPAIIA